MPDRDAVIAFLKDATLDRAEVDRFLDPDSPSWARFDAELGYLPNDSEVPDNIDGAISTYRYGRFGERRQVNGAGHPCRINSYGDSFTQCHQVSDGETWQEVLAARLQEPVRNFGVGGWSVYQAYLRMLREEKRAPAELIIFNIYDDDHFRNLDSWRNIRNSKHNQFIEPTLPYVAVNTKEGRFEERPNVCPTAESVYNLCDLDWVTNT